MTTPASIFEPRKRASYDDWVSLPIRFGDQDAMGHVNNATIASYFEHARVSLIVARVMPDVRTHINVVLARILIDYVREIRFPGSVDVGARVSKVGNKSFVISSGIFNGQDCVAVAEATLVFFDTKSRNAAAPTDEMRQKLGALMPTSQSVK